jgi:hypothetical protein
MAMKWGKDPGAIIAGISTLAACSKTIATAGHSRNRPFMAVAVPAADDKSPAEDSVQSDALIPYSP